MVGQVIVQKNNKNLKKLIFFFTRHLSGVTLKIHLDNNSCFPSPLSDNYCRTHVTTIPIYISEITVFPPNVATLPYMGTNSVSGGFTSIGKQLDFKIPGEIAKCRQQCTDNQKQQRQQKQNPHFIHNEFFLFI